MCIYLSEQILFTLITHMVYLADTNYLLIRVRKYRIEYWRKLSVPWRILDSVAIARN